MEPITPARPKTGKSQLQPQIHPSNPTTPTAPPSLLATWVQNSQKQQAARVLFTPRTKQHVLAQKQQPSPTPQSARLPAHSSLHFPSTSHHTSSDSSESESEKSLETALAALDIRPQSSSGSLSQDSPCAGPHSIHRKKALKPRGGAKDVWTFFTKSLGRQICSLCQ